MTIAKRLNLLAAVPLLVLIGLGLFTTFQLAGIEARSRFVAETQIGSLATLGNIYRAFTELRVHVRNHLLGRDQAERDVSRASLRAEQANLTTLLGVYEDRFVSDEKDRRLMNDFRAVSRDYLAGAEQVMSLADEGHRDEALASLLGPVGQLAETLGKASSEWIAYNEQLATRNGRATVESIEGSLSSVLIAVGLGLALSGLLGVLTFRGIVYPIRGLQTTVESIAGGNYAQAVPFTQATDETGELARAIDILKSGAAAMDEQRWVKTQAATLTGALQGASSLAEFGQRLLSGLVPVLGGGVAGFYLFQDKPGRLRRLASYGLAEGNGSGETFELGQGLAGQCANERTAVRLSHLPPDYLRVSSALGGTAPTQAVARPLMTHDTLLAVVEFASFREPRSNEQALLDEVLPLAAMRLDILQRSLRTEELLDETRSQARQLEAHTRQLMHSQHELLEQKEELLAQQLSLRASEEQFRTLIEAVPDALVISDEDGRIQLINAQTEQVFGYGRDELVGQPVEILVPEPLRSIHPANRQRFHASPAVRTMGRGMTLSAVRKDRSEFPVEISLSPLPEVQGRGRLVCSLVRDITERKRAENEIRLAMQKAEEATKAKSAFLANMSHEIRTPMNGIMGMTELALDTELTAEQRDYLTTVKSSADALLSLINDILDFSKIEAGRIELDPIEFLLRDSVSDMLNPLALRAGSKGLELAYDVDSDVPDALVGDVHRLRQVIVNLVGNAIKFTQKGEVVVSVGVTERSGDDVRLEVTVRDTGIGIEPAAAARLFKPFEQADAATTRKYGGTGLGLAISRQLVQLMGGEIRLESTPGVGSAFVFTVRVKTGTPRLAANVQDAAQLFEGKTALIVDDNETNRRILAAMLAHWGLRSIQADSASHALAALDRTTNAGQPVCVLITDLHMPDMDGFQLIEALRSRADGGELPVLLLTSSGSPGDQDQSARLRVAARLLKPVKQSLLLDNLVRVLAAANRIDKPRAPAATGPSGTAARGVALRVLLAEDNPVNQKFAIRVLEGAGHHVTVAHNGRQAVDLSGSQDFDLVLMDVQMPEMDGLEATRAIRGREADSGRRTPIIAMTANAMAGDRQMCIDAGMDGYVAKPVKKDALFAEITRVAGECGEGDDRGAGV